MVTKHATEAEQIGPVHPYPLGGPGAMLSPASIGRLLTSLIKSEATRMRGSQGSVVTISDSTPIDEEGLGFDSLARLELVAAVNRFFCLQDTGIEDYLLVHRTFGEWVSLVGDHFRLVGSQARFGFTTSGSTGTPKVLLHSRANLEAEVASLVRLLQRQSGRGRLLAMVPPHHIYGFLFTVLLPERLSIPVLDLTARAASSCLREGQTGDIVIGTPFTWSLVVATTGSFAPGVTGIVSTAPAAPTLWAECAQIGLEQLVEIYGSSETAGVGTRSVAGHPFQLMPHLLQSGGVVTKNGEVQDLQDRIDWQPGNGFTVAGRKDHMAQVGGVNVSPARISQMISEQPGVAEAAVRAADRLRAFVVPADPNADPALLEAELRGWANRHLSAPERPISYSFGSALPRDRMGKLVDWDLAPV